jgi:regulator of cell morphogenesis and NO signaling
MRDKSIVRYYEDDHDRLDTLFQQFRGSKSSSADNATRMFLEFSNGLLRHIRWEEEILFPLFEQKTGMYDRGPTVAMRSEHAIIKRHLDAIAQKISSRDFTTDEDEQLLVNTLVLHTQKEEQFL